MININSSCLLPLAKRSIAFVGRSQLRIVDIGVNEIRGVSRNECRVISNSFNVSLSLHEEATRNHLNINKNYRSALMKKID